MNIIVLFAALSLLFSFTGVHASGTECSCCCTTWGGAKECSPELLGLFCGIDMARPATEFWQSDCKNPSTSYPTIQGDRWDEFGYIYGCCDGNYYVSHTSYHPDDYQTCCRGIDSGAGMGSSAICEFGQYCCNDEQGNAFCANIPCSQVPCGELNDCELCVDGKITLDTSRSECVSVALALDPEYIKKLTLKPPKKCWTVTTRVLRIDTCS